MQTDYLNGLLDRRMYETRMKRLIKALNKFDQSFDTIVGTGLSGSIVLPLAHTMKKKVCFVRKDKVLSHSQFNIEGPNQIGNYVIVDDTVAEGTTISYIVKQISKYYTKETVERWSKKKYKHFKYPKLLGIFLYDQHNKTALHNFRQGQHKNVYLEVVK